MAPSRAFLLLVLRTPVAGEDYFLPTHSAVHVADPRIAAAVTAALDGASRRLSDPRCHAALDHPAFRDGHGRSPAMNLTDRGETGPSYLRTLVFEDGGESGDCAEMTLAFTRKEEPRVVHVCPRFLRAWKRDHLVGEVAIIHEALHTLGLGENPPSSGGITDTIASYCGG